MNVTASGVNWWVGRSHEQCNSTKVIRVHIAFNVVSMYSTGVFHILAISSNLKWFSSLVCIFYEYMLIFILGAKIFNIKLNVNYQKKT